jgi:NADP-dependent 3-hydroxy acid dehydrogenase YdfG
VVTGAACGIGRGMVENFLQLGMKVVFTDFDKDKIINDFMFILF